MGKYGKSQQSAPATKMSTGTPKPVHAQQKTQVGRTRNTAKLTQAHPVQICLTDNSTQDQDQKPYELEGNPIVERNPIVLQSTSTPPQNQDCENVLLLTGNARVWNDNSKEWQSVEILFDTGADQSFINEALAEELGLMCTEVRELSMYTFGTRDPVSTTCGVTFLDLWDDEGGKHKVRLYATPVLTGKGKFTYLTQDDMDFITHHNIRLSKNSRREESRTNQSLHPTRKRQNYA